MASPFINTSLLPTQKPVTANRTIGSTPTGTGAFTSGNYALQTPAAAPNFASIAQPIPGYPGVKSPVAAKTVTGGNVSPTSAFTTPAQTPLQDPGNNLVNQGYGEQALNQTQNRLLQDPAAAQLQTQYNAANTPTQGQNYMNQNLGTLDGAGQGDQYWNQVQGQFNDPFAGEQFTREATQNFSPTGAAGAFNDQAQQRTDQFTNFQGAGNSQGQYGQSSQSLANGTQGEQGLSQIAGQFGTTGQYTDPNLAAGQYAQTQGAFGEFALPTSADPYYDRAIQLGTQSYNNDAASRGVYGSSAALSGVGNVITDLEAQRAQKTFDNQMAIEVEQRNRQQLLGEQASMGDTSSVNAFNAGLKGAETFGNINNQQGQLEISRNQTLGQMATNADTQANNAQNSNISGLNALGSAAQAADTAETNRYQASTGAMNAADQTTQNRLNSGVSNALAVDANTRGDFTASQNAATNAAQTDQSGTRLAADIANQGSQNDLNRLNAFNNTAQGAETQRFNRQVQTMADQFKLNDAMQDTISGALESASKYNADAFDTFLKTEITPYLQDASMSEREKSDFITGIKEMFDDAHNLAD